MPGLNRCDAWELGQRGLSDFRAVSSGRARGEPVRRECMRAVQRPESDSQRRHDSGGGSERVGRISGVKPRRTAAAGSQSVLVHLHRGCEQQRHLHGGIGHQRPLGNRDIGGRTVVGSGDANLRVSIERAFVARGLIGGHHKAPLLRRAGVECGGSGAGESPRAAARDFSPYGLGMTGRGDGFRSEGSGAARLTTPAHSRAGLCRCGRCARWSASGRAFL